jgi:glycosyltransferase involved in cell wall biosynthesis
MNLETSAMRLGLASDEDTKLVRMAYLMSQYPAVSHTFFLREVLGLRKLGIEIHTASINKMQPTPICDDAELAEAGNTFYIKEADAVSVLVTVLRVMLLRPVVFFRGLRTTYRLRPQRYGGLLYSMFYFGEALLLGEWMSRMRLRHLHVHFATAVATVGCIAADAYSIPISMMVHGSDEFYDKSLYALPQKIAQASFVLCISDFCRSQLMCLSAPQHWNKLHVVRLGVDPEEFKPAAHTESKATRLLCVGRLVAAKGHLILLESIAQLRNRGLDVHLTLAGDGPLRAELTAWTSEQGLENAIYFAGSCSRSQTRALFDHADIFVLASFAEGVPVALMEAMALELPCVSTQIAGIPELIHNEHDGLLVTPASPDAISEAIEWLIADPALCRTLGTAARITIERDYNLNINIARLAAVFRQELRREAA